MGKKIKRANLWVRRKSHISVVLILGGLILLLFFNEDVSLTKSRQYDSEISELKADIKLCEDSATYYENKYKELTTGVEDLERLARENYKMQRPTEDVYIIK